MLNTCTHCITLLLPNDKYCDFCGYSTGWRYILFGLRKWDNIFDYQNKYIRQRKTINKKLLSIEGIVDEIESHNREDSISSSYKNLKVSEKALLKLDAKTFIKIHEINLVQISMNLKKIIASIEEEFHLDFELTNLKENVVQNQNQLLEVEGAYSSYDKEKEFLYEFNKEFLELRMELRFSSEKILDQILTIKTNNVLKSTNKYFEIDSDNEMVFKEIYETIAKSELILQQIKENEYEGEFETLVSKIRSEL